MRGLLLALLDLHGAVRGNQLRLLLCSQRSQLLAVAKKMLVHFRGC